MSSNLEKSLWDGESKGRRWDGRVRILGKIPPSNKTISTVQRSTRQYHSQWHFPKKECLFHYRYTTIYYMHPQQQNTVGQWWAKALVMSKIEEKYLLNQIICSANFVLCLRGISDTQGKQKHAKLASSIGEPFSKSEWLKNRIKVCVGKFQSVTPKPINESYVS